MSRIDLSKLRKRAGMSQRELASLLQVRPSFLSAIENGRSRLPEEKQEKIKEIFALDSLEEYMIDDLADVVVPPHTHVPPHSHDGDASIPPHIHTSPSTQSDAITQLLNHFHDLAHQRDRQHTSADEETAARIDLLERRNVLFEVARKTIHIIHQKFATTKNPGFSPEFVAEFGLDLVSVHR